MLQDPSSTAFHITQISLRDTIPAKTLSAVGGWSEQWRQHLARTQYLDKIWGMLVSSHSLTPPGKPLIFQQVIF